MSLCQKIENKHQVLLQLVCRHKRDHYTRGLLCVVQVTVISCTVAMAAELRTHLSSSNGNVRFLKLIELEGVFERRRLFSNCSHLRLSSCFPIFHPYAFYLGICDVFSPGPDISDKQLTISSSDRD